MKLGKEALGIGALVMALSGGCESKSITISGTPVNMNINGGNLVTLLQVEGASILAYADYYHRNGPIAAQLLRSEIVDGDNETVVLTGWYENDNREFEIDSLTANGYTIYF